jgi:molecular chaperone DnaK
VPQIQVSFDIDANGILQVSARDKTTGREQSVTIQGSSTLTDAEVNRMMRDAEQFAQEDRERREKVEKRNRAKALTDQAQRRLKEVTLDFGSQFASYYRRRIESLSQEILEGLKQNDDRRLDRAQADLQDALYELNREVRLQYGEENDSFFTTIKKTLIGDDEDDAFYDSRQSGRPGAGYPPQRGGYGYDAPRSTPPERNYDYNPRPPQSPPNQGYGRAYDDGLGRSPQPPSRQQPPQNYSGNYSGNSGNRPMDQGYDNGVPPRRPPKDKPKSNPRKPKPGARDPYEQRNVSRKYYSQGQGRNIPYENDWDEDDEWF